MYAAVLTSFDAPPEYREHPVPVAGPGQVLVDVLAAPLHHLTMARATGRHYSTASVLPLIPGVDGVVRDDQGRCFYTLLDETRCGTFAQHTVMDPARSLALPEAADPVAVAAAMNPAMSSWIALRRRIRFEPGQRVLVLGATGSAGRAALQVARRLGAGQVIAVGRELDRLSALRDLGADEVCTFDQAGAAAAEADVVLDYVWGEPAADVMPALLSARPDRSRPLTWVQIGSLAGAAAPVPAAALRSADLRIVGSGIGSVPAREILRTLPELVAAIIDGAVAVTTKTVALSNVSQAWRMSAQERTVFVP